MTSTVRSKNKGRQAKRNNSIKKQIPNRKKENGTKKQNAGSRRYICTCKQSSTTAPQ